MDQSKDPYKTTPLAFKGNAKVYYDAIVKMYDLNDHELMILHNICQSLMLVETLRSELALQDLLIVGANGMDRANPLLAEIARHSTLMLSHIKQLNLPSSDAEGNPVVETPEGRSAEFRDLARKRWDKRVAS